ncbi:Uncharacterised protein [Mycobacteroides abscessus subsp. abscessus]|nr:Uncharacterised protein [Mycobacteroides abscessus subsp. abscessus]
MEFTQIAVQRLQCDQWIEHVNRRIADLLRAGAVLLGEDLREGREGQGQAAGAFRPCAANHVDRQSLIYPVGRAGPPPGDVQGNVGAAAGGGIAMKSLYHAKIVPGNDQPNAGIPPE